MSALLYRPDAQTIQLRAGEQAPRYVDVERLSGRHFFGEPSTDSETIVAEELPETELQLTLRGAFQALHKEKAGAIIEDDAQNSSHYVIGDTLPGDATLKAVNANSVVLSRNGVLETLYFPEDETPAAGWSPSSNISDAQARERREAVRKRIKALRGGGPLAATKKKTTGAR